MATALNLQRNSRVFMSTVDATAEGGSAFNSTNTWRVEVLAGYAASQSAATTDITSLESGLNPDRSTQRFNTAINPTEWSFSTYLRPTGMDTTSDDTSANVMPVADWFLWQSLLSNTSWEISDSLVSVWQDGGKFELQARTGHTPNYATATEYYMYIQMDNVYYQVKDATVNEATVDAAIDGIATTNWSGFGTDFIELTGTNKDNIASAVGGYDSSGAAVSANANAEVSTSGYEHHSWAQYTTSGGTVTADFIKNRLSSIVVTHTPDGSAEDTYTFPVTGLGFTYNNALTYLTPEEIASLNVPIGQFTGSRAITGNFTAYLRTGEDQSAQFLRNIVNDTRTSLSEYSSANLQIGGTTAPFVAIDMPAVNLNFPTHSIEDVIGISVEFLAQETNKGTGDELTLVVSGTN